MRINNNVMALNAHRQLGINQTGASKSMERLSSGFRINRAGDDAAGLAISEKMRGQIRGLKQATRNAQDGISLIQTAEGALNETHAILQRMRELAVQSSTDTNEPDRDEIQKEINQLADEITRISTDTEFNTQNLLGGTFKDKIFHIGANEAQNVKLSIADMSAKALGVAGKEGIEREVETAGVDSFDNANLHVVDVAEKTFDVVKLDKEVTVQLDGTTDSEVNYVLTDEDGKVVAVSEDGTEYSLLSTAVEVADLATATEARQGAATYADATAFDAFEFGDAVISGKVTFSEEDNGEITASGTATIKLEEGAELAAGEYTVVDTDHAFITAGFGLVNSKGDLVAVSADGMDWKTLGGDDLFTAGNAYAKDDVIEISTAGGLDVSSQAAADKAITTINTALQDVSGERSKLGAMQNRLEHTIANLGTSAENLQAAESRIRDLDMADEIMAFTKNNILQQAATAMLAQANMAPQSVLQLLG